MKTTKPYRIKTEDDLVEQYNLISEKHLQLKSTLKDLTDYEFYVWIAGRTYLFSRSLEDSLENAEKHLKNREKVWIFKQSEVTQ